MNQAVNLYYLKMTSKLEEEKRCNAFSRLTYRSGLLNELPNNRRHNKVPEDRFWHWPQENIGF